MSHARAFYLRKIAEEALKPPERTRSFTRVRGSVFCTLSASQGPWTLHVTDGDWTFREGAPHHIITIKELHEWAAERLRALADEQEREL